MEISILTQITQEFQALGGADALSIATLAVLEGILSVDNSLVKFRISREKLHRQKTALMQDLLTGKVRVTALLEAEAR